MLANVLRHHLILQWRRERWQRLRELPDRKSNRADWEVWCSLQTPYQLTSWWTFSWRWLSLAYLCTSSQKIQSIKKDTSVSTDASGMLKISPKATEQTCEANTELKLRSALQRRNLAMDLAGLVTFETAETWTETLFSHLLREQPRGLAKVSLQQLLDCDKQMFTMASHKTMGNLREAPDNSKPLDDAINELKSNSEILQYLMPLPVVRSHEAPASSGSRPEKVQKTEKGKGTNKGGNKGNPAPKVQLPESCTSHDDENRPLCFAFQNGKCKFKGPPGKRCARGFHKCYKKGCFRAKPYYLCTHTD